MDIKKTNGITLVALVITVIVLAIVAGIAFSSGKEVIKKANLESLQTNMLLIQAKSKEYVEKASFKMGVNPDGKTPEEKQQIRDEVYGSASEEGAKLEKANEADIPSKFGIADTSTCYWLSQQAMENWGLNKMELQDDEKYLIQFDETNETVEVYNTIGYEGKYKLSEINTINLEE